MGTDSEEHTIMTKTEQAQLDDFKAQLTKDGKPADYIAKEIAAMKKLFLAKRKIKKTTELQMTLWAPQMPDKVPSLPKGEAPHNNYAARSNLFIPTTPHTKRDERIKVELECPSNCTMTYEGYPLGIADDAFVYFHALQLAANTGKNGCVRFNRADFLRAIGWKTKHFGSKEYNWLQQSFSRLSDAKVHFDTPKIRGWAHLLGGMTQTKDDNIFEFSIPPEALALFSGQYFAYINIPNRIKVKGRSKSITLWMQSYIASHHDGKHSNKLTDLHTWSGHKTKISLFLTYMEQALAQLIELKEISDASITQKKPAGESIISWIKGDQLD